MSNLKLPLHTLKGVGNKTEELFQHLHIDNLMDLLMYFPRDYQSFPMPVDHTSQLVVGQNAAITGIFRLRPVNRHFRSMDITIASLDTGHEKIDVIWYRMPYISKNIQIGIPYTIYGRIGEKNNELRVEQPSLHVPEAYIHMTKKLQPVYSLTKGLSNNLIRKTMKQAYDLCLPLPDPLPKEILSKRGLLDYTEAIHTMHSPDTYDGLSNGVRRFSYQEFLVFFLALRMEENGLTKELNHFLFTKDSQMHHVMDCLPFQLTKGQRDALDDLLHDFHSNTIEERLIQGDVGSGKTIIAFLAMVYMAENGYQSAIMAPTEVLAEQHHRTFLKYISDFDLPFHVTFLSGSLKASEKRAAYESIRSGEADFIIGTHALIQDAVDYKNLSLVITDEQHRFGVKQRDRFSKKGIHPFSVVMSATPIPRTLALILYDGMNVSSIRDVPSERLRVKTAGIPDSKRDSAWNFIKKQVQEGHQAYVICPLVEESENLDQENVTDYGKNLQKQLKGIATVGILHGRMRPEEKDKVMQAFQKNEIQVLVSTTVVEVGVNVPNATLIMIENADRFGLAQLHQLRGRVGRGQWQSYCILMNSQKKNKETSNKRLDIMNHCYNGFEIAEEDLKLRGPGDARGIRQSGDSPFTFADVYKDSDLLAMASEDAYSILDEDQELTSDKFSLLRDLVIEKSEETYTNL